MRTVILQQPGQFAFTETEPPGSPGAQEALVRVRRVGICGTDLHAFRGDQPFFTYPRILGHELGVEIEEIRPNELGLKAGDRCAVEPYLNCGRCIACRRGKTNCCVKLKVLGVHTDGGMRERILVPIRKLHKAERLTLDQLALVETLGIGAHAVDRARLDAGEFALVIGAGPIGLSVIEFAKLTGAHVIVLDVNEGRLDFCRERLGVEFCIHAAADPLAAIEQITSGDLPTAVFDATGSAPSMMQAFHYVAHGGRLILVGLTLDDITFSDPHLHRREIAVLGTRNATRSEFLRIIRLMEGGRLDTTPWITHRAALEATPTVFPSWLQPESRVIKAVVEV